MRKIFKGVINFTINLLGFAMLLLGADRVGQKIFGELYFAFWGFALFATVLVHQAFSMEESAKKKDEKIAKEKSKVLNPLYELDRTIKELYQDNKIDIDATEELLRLTKEATTNTYEINNKHSFPRFK